ncbi:MAG: SAM hydrolase/SAM-dependent halogenase family protein [Thermomicrobiales bacterium]
MSPSEPAKPRRVITLTTDFGLSDHYVGTMKGVLLSRCPEAQIVDISHEIRPFSIISGAYAIDQALSYFPPGSIHVVVIDPGVGTPRKPLLVEAAGQYFIAPDNGVLSFVLHRDPRAIVWEISNRDVMMASPSATFHGRDIFAPAAAALAGGAAFTVIGPALDRASLVRLPDFWATWETRAALGGVVRGKVVHIDRFGNLITNIRRDLFAALPPTALAAARVRTRHHDCAGIATTYGEQPPGTIVALFGSAGVLEIARVNGRADRTPRGQLIALGLPVEVTVG